MSVFLSSGDCGKEGVRSPLLRMLSPRPAPAQLLPLACPEPQLQICVREEQLPQQSRTDGDGTQGCQGPGPGSSRPCSAVYSIVEAADMCTCGNGLCRRRFVTM